MIKNISSINQYQLQLYDNPLKSTSSQVIANIPNDDCKEKYNSIQDLYSLKLITKNRSGKSVINK